MIDFYENFVDYYEKLAKKRKHFENQANLLHNLFLSLNIKSSSYILDAACGTGAVGNMLFEKGYQNISLTDGSFEMVNHAKNNVNSNVPVYQYRWQELDAFFSKEGSFDTIFIIGNSLAHAKNKSLSNIFTNIYTGLNKDGYFIFDIREWSINENGETIQPKKPHNFFDSLGEIFVNGSKLEVDNLIQYDYKELKQIVSYVIKDYKSKNNIETIKLEYSMYSFEDILPTLISVGFKADNIIRVKIENWPYQLTYCKK